MGTRGFQEKARSTATELERCHQERSQENGHQLGRGWRGCGGQEGLEESCRPMHLWREMNQEPGIAELFLYNTPCLRKNGAFLFLLELCQISTNFNVLVSRWQKGWNCILHIHFPPHLTHANNNHTKYFAQTLWQIVYNLWNFHRKFANLVAIPTNRTTKHIVCCKVHPVL